jgi:hypothetical protein
MVRARKGRACESTCSLCGLGCCVIAFCPRVPAYVGDAKRRNRLLRRVARGGAPDTSSTTQCQEHSHTLTNTTGAQYPLTRARCVASPATTHHTTTEGQSPAPSTIATRSASTSPPSPQPPQAPASSIAPKPHPRTQPRDARHRDHGTNANASTPTTRPVTRKAPAHAASTTPSHPQHTRTAATPARQRTGPEESALSSITPLSRTTRAMARFASPAHAASHTQPSAPHESAARELAPPDRSTKPRSHSRSRSHSRAARGHTSYAAWARLAHSPTICSALPRACLPC